MSTCLGNTTLGSMIDGTLMPDARRALVAHLDTCARCRSLVADAVATGAMPSVVATMTSPREADGRAARAAVGVAATPTVTSPPPALHRAGATIGRRYRLGAPLGRGGMGVVFEAMQLDLGRTVAIKLLAPSPDPVSHSRFEREARALARLAHPNIVSIFDYGIDAGIPYVVMAHLRGRTLFGALLAEPRFEPGRAVDIASQILAGLAAAHGAGIVHRDIKPGNIFLVGSEEEVKLLDFGLAGLVDGSQRLTETGGVVGTPAYMAPEQILHGGVDPRTDLRAVGACLFEMLAGRRLFVGDSAHDIAAQIIRGPSLRVDAVRTDVPAGLADVIARSTSQDPSVRFSSAGELIAALAPWRAAGRGGGFSSSIAAGRSHAPPGHCDAAAHALPKPPATSGARGAPPRSRGAIVVLLSIVAAACLCIACFLLVMFRDRRSSPETRGAQASASAATTMTTSSPSLPNDVRLPTASGREAPSSSRTQPLALPPVRSACLCIASDGQEICPKKFTTCQCRSKDGDALFSRPQTKESIDSITREIDGQGDGDPCSGFTRATSKTGESMSLPGSGALWICNDCDDSKAHAHPVMALPGTPCAGVHSRLGSPASGVWQPPRR